MDRPIQIGLVGYGKIARDQHAPALRRNPAFQLVAAADRVGATTVVLSEYAIESVSRPVHVNRALRDAGLLVTRPGPGGDTLDVYNSAAFALADHTVLM